MNNNKIEKATKKSYSNIVDYLEAKKGQLITDDIMQTIYSLTNQKNSQSSKAIYQDDKLIAIYCWQHKQFELLDEVEYGLKASSSTGYNTFCKIAVRVWTTKQKMLKAVAVDVLKDVEAKKIDVKEIKAEMSKRRAKIETAVDMKKPKGYETEAEAIAAYKAK